MLQGLPFHVGDAMEVIILERSHSASEKESPSQMEDPCVFSSPPYLIGSRWIKKSAWNGDRNDRESFE
jgi:hypothetical protein